MCIHLKVECPLGTDQYSVMKELTITSDLFIILNALCTIRATKYRYPIELILCAQSKWDTKIPIHEDRGIYN